MDYDVIVIGGGLGGLTAANRLAMLGHRVLLLEQHRVLGGLAAWFKRGNDIFDVALHGFPIGMKKTLRKYWSREISENVVQLERIVFDNPQFQLETTFTETDFRRILAEEFDVAHDTVDAFFKELRAMDFYDDQTETTRELFERYFAGRSDVVRLLMEPIAYANGSTLDEPAITYGIVFSNFMSKGVYTIEGGTDWLIGAMRAELEKNGVDIKLKTPATRILVEHGRVSGLEAGGERYSCRAVVSNANLKNTIAELIGPESVPSEFMASVRDLRLSTSSAQVYIGLKDGETIPDIGDLLFTSTAPEFDSALLSAKEITSRTFSVYYPRTRPGHDHCTIVASMNARYDDWKDLPDEDYEAGKTAMIEQTLGALDKYVPGIRGKVRHLEAATPRTFERYTWHRGGASFGTKFEGLAVSTGLPEAVPGAFHTGSAAIIMSGWLGAANYGAIIAGNVDHYLEERC